MCGMYPVVIWLCLITVSTASSYTVTSTSEPTTTSGSLAISAPTPVREPTARIVYLSDLCAGDQSYVEEEGIIAEQVAQLLTVQYIIDQHNLANASSKVGEYSVHLHEGWTGFKVDGRLLIIMYVGEKLWKFDYSRWLSAIVQGTSSPVISTEHSCSDCGDSIGHPHSENYFNTKSSDIEELQLILKFILKLRWSYVIIVSTNNTYGNSAAAYMRSQLQALDPPICVALDLEITAGEDDDANNEIIWNIASRIRDSEATGVLYLGTAKEANWLIDEYLRQIRDLLHGRSKIFVLPSEVGRSKEIQRLLLTPRYLKVFSVSRLPGSEQAVFNITDHIKSVLEGQPQLAPSIPENILDRVQPDHALATAPDILKRTADAANALVTALTEAENPIHYLNSLSFLDNSHFTNDGASQQEHRKTFAVNQINSTEPYTHQVAYMNADNKLVIADRLVIATSYSSCKSECSSCPYETVDDEPEYIYIHKDYYNYVVLGTDVLYDFDQSSLSCSRNISTQGYQAMQAFYNGHERFENATNMNISTLFIPHCGSDRKLRRTLDAIFSTNGEAQLVDDKGHSYSIPTNKIILAIGDSDSSKTMILKNFLSPHDIPIVSPGSSSYWMDNTDEYRTLLRPTPSYATLVPVILQVLQQLKIQAAAIVYSNSPDGRSARQLLLEQAHSSSICISKQYLVDSTVASVEQIGERLGQDETVPRVVLAFVDERVKSILLNSVHRHDIWWYKKGRIFLMVGGIPISSKHDDLFKGSLSIEPTSDFKWSKQFSNNHNTHETETPSQPSLNNNRYLAYFWQQKLQCYMKDSPFLLRKFEKPCDLACEFSTTADQNCPASQLKFPDSIIADNIYLAWRALTSLVNTTARHGHSELMDNRTSMMHGLQSCTIKVPGSDDIKLVNTNTHQGNPMYTVKSILSPKENDEVFSYRNGNLDALRTPTFYIKSAVDPDFSSTCAPQTACDCDQAVTGTSIPTTPRHSKQDNSKTCSEFGLTIGEIVLIVLIVIVLMVAVVLLVKIIRNRYGGQEEEEGGERGRGGRFKVPYRRGTKNKKNRESLTDPHQQQITVIEEGQTEVTAADGRPQLPEIPSVPGPLVSTHSQHHEPANERRVSFTQASVHHIPSRPAIESDDYPPSSHPSDNEQPPVESVVRPKNERKRSRSHQDTRSDHPATLRTKLQTNPGAAANNIPRPMSYFYVKDRFHDRVQLEENTQYEGQENYAFRYSQLDKNHNEANHLYDVVAEIQSSKGFNPAQSSGMADQAEFGVNNETYDSGGEVGIHSDPGTRMRERGVGQSDTSSYTLQFGPTPQASDDNEASV